MSKGFEGLFGNPAGARIGPHAAFGSQQMYLEAWQRQNAKVGGEYQEWAASLQEQVGRQNARYNTEYGFPHIRTYIREQYRRGVIRAFNRALRAMPAQFGEAGRVAEQAYREHVAV